MYSTNVWCMFCIRNKKTKNAKRVVLLYYLKYVFLISKSFYGYAAAIVVPSE